jgi:hypothetical protein
MVRGAANDQARLTRFVTVIAVVARVDPAVAPDKGRLDQRDFALSAGGGAAHDRSREEKT